MFQPAAGVFHLESAVMHIGLWAQTNFLDFDLGLGFTSQAFFFGLLEKEFPHINYFDHWRICGCCDLDQVKPGVPGSLQGYFDCDDAPVFPIGVN
jgi:hypothetical protein